jgi:hypothetical protein
VKGCTGKLLVAEIRTVPGACGNNFPTYTITHLPCFSFHSLPLNLMPPFVVPHPSAAGVVQILVTVCHRAVFFLPAAYGARGTLQEKAQIQRSADFILLRAPLIIAIGDG